MDPQLIRDLARPEAFPESPRTVSQIQTHLSLVCLTDDLVYKLRKPVDLGFVDFTSQEARRQDCEAELRLNRRLCPDVYLDVVPLFRTDTGYRFATASPTGLQPVEHAVRMQRLPADRMMDQLLADGSVRPREVDQLAAQISAFHRRVTIHPQPGEPGHPDQLLSFAADNFTATAPFCGEHLDRTLHDTLAAAALRALEGLHPRLVARIEKGRTVDGHGDLHARNICLTDPPVAYDCLEFSPELRCGDSALEHAFLVMDLIQRGAPELANRYTQRASQESRDPELATLLPPLVAYRAMVRAKVETMAASDPDVPPADRDSHRGQARDLLRLAAGAIAGATRPALVMACGLPASGKSHVLQGLARSCGWPLLQSDSIRKELAGVAPGATAPDHAYLPEMTERVYGELRRRAAADARAKRHPVLLDATFQDRRQRDLVRSLAAELGYGATLLHLNIPAELAAQRLQERQGRTISDADGDVRQRMLGTFMNPTPGEQAIVLDGSLQLGPLLDQVLTAMLPRPPDTT